jgi:outer membrane lipoprotein-sorting protein
MKKFFLITSCILLVVVIDAQSLEEIVSRYTIANKLDNISSIQTLKITAKISMKGTEMPMEMWMKNPDKFRTVTSMKGSEMIQVFDGEKGYMINSALGSNEPKEMTPEQIKEYQRGNYLINTVKNFLDDGQLTLIGEDNVLGKPVYKIKAVLEKGFDLNMFIDKDSYLIIRNTIVTYKGGIPTSVNDYPSDYTEFDGVLLPMKTIRSFGRMESVMTITNVEVNVPIDDSVFRIK